MTRRINNIQITAPGAPDAQHLAEVLCREIENYRVPKEVARRAGITRMAQAKEPWLVVICTPESPADAAVKEDIGAFLAENPFSRMLSLLADGEPAESFPESLVYERKADGSVVEHEPLAANVGKGTRRQKEKRLKTEKLRIIAPILGVGYDDLLNRRRRARQRSILAAGAAVLAAAVAFLGYSLSRMRVISGQNRTLEGYYETADAARSEAADQRDEAERAYVRTVAMEADTELAKGNTELAMLLCLQYLPDMQEVGGLGDVLAEALDTACAGGYVPVASKADYMASRGIAKEETERGALYRYLPPPEELAGEMKMAEYSLRIRSEEFGFEVYGGGSSSYDLWYSRVCFPDEPDKDYTLRDEDGALLYVQLDSLTRGGGVQSINNCVVLDDGSMIDIHDGRPYRVDIPTGRIVDFFDEGGAGDSLAGKEDVFTYLFAYEGTDVVLAATSSGTVEVWQRSPLAYLYTMEDVKDVVDGGGADFLIGEGEGELVVFARSPFRELYRLSDEYITSKQFRMTRIRTAKSGGRNYLAYGWTVYNLDEGTLTGDFRLEAQSQGGAENPLFSSDGYLLLPGYRSVSVLDAVTGKEFSRIRAVIPPEGSYRGSFEPFGPEDPLTGVKSAEAVLVDGVVYEYRKKRDIPDDPDRRILLARELLGSRDFTEQEKKRFEIP